MSFAQELRERALATKANLLKDFITNFSVIAENAADKGQTQFTYYPSKNDLTITEQVGQWFRDNGFQYKINHDQRDGHWIEIKF